MHIKKILIFVWSLCILSVTVVNMLATEWALIMTLFRKYYGAAVYDKKKLAPYSSYATRVVEPYDFDAFAEAYDNRKIESECGKEHLLVDYNQKIKLTASCEFFMQLARDFMCALFPDLKFVCFEIQATERLNQCLTNEMKAIQWVDKYPIFEITNFYDLTIVDRTIRLNDEKDFVDRPLWSLDTDAKQFNKIPLRDKIRV